VIGFQDPEALLGLLLIPLLFTLYKKALSKKRKEAMAFSNVSLLKAALGSKAKLGRDKRLFAATLASLALLITALANPTLPLEKTRKGVTVVLAIDVSGSMQATDYKPNRLEAAKRAAQTLVKSLKAKDDVGVVIFESGATTAAYLTPYKEKVLEKIKNIAPRQGRTAIGDGLSLAVDMATSIPNKKRIVILLSDGVNNAGVVTVDEAVSFAKDNKVQVYTIGMGSKRQVILGYDFFGNPQYARLDEETLKRIARETNGRYFKSVNAETLSEIYKTISKDIKREKEDTNVKDYFIAAAILVLLAELYYRYGYRRVMQ